MSLLRPGNPPFVLRSSTKSNELDPVYGETIGEYELTELAMTAGEHEGTLEV